jgi:F420-non-reducing hydrogenase small subunit
LDGGAKALSAVASLLDATKEAEIERILESIPDPVGLFYRYSLPASLIHRRAGNGRHI